jgi:hypothetical protein
MAGEAIVCLLSVKLTENMTEANQKKEPYIEQANQQQANKRL